jgi:hypothetical protein
VFELLEQTFRTNGPEAVIDLVIAQAREQKNYRELFAARLMQVRQRLGLPLIETEPVSGPEYEKALREAARETGELFLADGDIVSAWPYFRAIDEPSAVAAAIESVDGGENLDRVIEIAFQEAVNTRKGFELILQHHGICRAITWFGSIRDFSSRQECLRLLVRALYQELARALQETIASSEGARPATDNVAELISGRAWLFEGGSYYVDSTHVTSVLQSAPELEDAQTLRMAVEIADYGRLLAPMYHFRGDPPFEDPYADHAVYLRALLGEEVDAAIAHFRQKATDQAAAGGDPAPAEVLIVLLVRLGRHAEAVRTSLEFFPGSQAAPASCPSVLQLCQMAGDYETLLSLARERDDRLSFVAAVVQGSNQASNPGSSPKARASEPASEVSQAGS